MNLFLYQNPREMKSDAGAEGLGSVAGAYILERWQSNVIYFLFNVIKVYFEVWRDEKLGVNFGLPANSAVEIDTARDPSLSSSKFRVEFRR